MSPASTAPPRPESAPGAREAVPPLSPQAIKLEGLDRHDSPRPSSAGIASTPRAVSSRLSAVTVQAAVSGRAFDVGDAADHPQVFQSSGSLRLADSVFTQSPGLGAGPNRVASQAVRSATDADERGHGNAGKSAWRRAVVTAAGYIGGRSHDVAQVLGPAVRGHIPKPSPDHQSPVSSFHSTEVATTGGALGLGGGGSPAPVHPHAETSSSGRVGDPGRSTWRSTVSQGAAFASGSGASDADGLGSPTRVTRLPSIFDPRSFGAEIGAGGVLPSRSKSGELQLVDYDGDGGGAGRSVWRSTVSRGASHAGGTGSDVRAVLGAPTMPSLQAHSSPQVHMGAGMQPQDTLRAAPAMRYSTAAAAAASGMPVILSAKRPLSPLSRPSSIRFVHSPEPGEEDAGRSAWRSSVAMGATHAGGTRADVADVLGDTDRGSTPDMDADLVQPNSNPAYGTDTGAAGTEAEVPRAEAGGMLPVSPGGIGRYGDPGRSAWRTCVTTGAAMAGGDRTDVAEVLGSGQQAGLPSRRRTFAEAVNTAVTQAAGLLQFGSTAKRSLAFDATATSDPSRRTSLPPPGNSPRPVAGLERPSSAAGHPMSPGEMVDYSVLPSPPASTGVDDSGSHSWASGSRVHKTLRSISKQGSPSLSTRLGYSRPVWGGAQGQAASIEVDWRSNALAMDPQPVLEMATQLQATRLDRPLSLSGPPEQGRDASSQSHMYAAGYRQSKSGLGDSSRTPAMAGLSSGRNVQVPNERASNTSILELDQGALDTGSISIPPCPFPPHDSPSSGAPSSGTSPPSGRRTTTSMLPRQAPISATRRPPVLVGDSPVRRATFCGAGTSPNMIRVNEMNSRMGDTSLQLELPGSPHGDNRGEAAAVSPRSPATTRPSRSVAWATPEDGEAGTGPGAPAQSGAVQGTSGSYASGNPTLRPSRLRPPSMQEW